MSGTIPSLMIFIKDTVRYFKKRQINKRLNEHIQIVHILQAEEHQGRILFLFCIHLHEIQQISSWKSISTQADESYNLLEILEGYLRLLFTSQHLARSKETNGLLAYSHFGTDPVSNEINRKLPLVSLGKQSRSSLVRLNTL